LASQENTPHIEGAGTTSLVAERPLPTAVTEQVELSVVMPCLDEAETLGVCVEKARSALEEHRISGEIIVADNGSTDGSQEIARSRGARVVNVPDRGYGNALMGGIAAARGRYVLMGDADDSYDFLQLPRFVEKLRQGYDLVQGCRLERGGGTVLPGAMPSLHRRIGNPLFSWIARTWFRAPINDVYCGLRAFSKQHYERLGQRCVGMEFATEMIVKSAMVNARIAEVPITLHPDGRTVRTPHLRTVRDGWRTLRFFLLYSPRWLFLLPGMFLIFAGLVGYALALPAVHAFGVTFDAHTLLVATLAVMCGYQAILFAVFTKVFATSQGLMPRDPRLDRAVEVITLERALLIAAGAVLAGCVLLALAVNQWRLQDFGHLNYASTMRLVVPGVLLVALGFQTLLSSFFISILGMQRR
jgi:glycosyltransferase involved in cell wall biosynthesis